MADAKFAVATTEEQALILHRKWMQDYNHQRHWGHEKREDGYHSPTNGYCTSLLSRFLLIIDESQNLFWR